MRFKNFNFLILIILSLLSLSVYSLKTLNYSQYNCRRSRDVIYPQEFLRFINGVGEQSGQMAEMFKIEWSDHIDNSRRLIIQGAQGITRDRVIVVGAGNCTDIPLEELTLSFQRVVLYDFDIASIEGARDMLSLELQNRVDLNSQDISSVGALFLRDTIGMVDNTTLERDVVRNIISYMDNMELPKEGISNDEEADYIVCSLVLSTLMWGEFLYLEQKIADKFGELEATYFLDDIWEEAKLRFKDRVVNNVIDILAATLQPGGRLLFIDSAIKHTTDNSVSGSLEDIQVFSAEHLRGLLKGRFSIDYEESWSWSYLPEDNSFNSVSEHEIEALILSLPQF